MATERKFAISTTPSQPGYEATYADLSAFMSAFASYDLQTPDQKFLVEIFPDYDGTTLTLPVERMDFRNWTGNRATDNIVRIQAVPGNEIQYPSLAGARITYDNTSDNFVDDGSCPVEFYGVSIENLGAGAPMFTASTGTVENTMDRCYVYKAGFSNGNQTKVYNFKLITNSIIHIEGFTGNYIFWGGQTSGAVLPVMRNVTGIAGSVMTGANRFFVYGNDMQNCIFTKESTSQIGSQGFFSCDGDYNASVSNDAPGANSIQNITPANEFVDEDTDMHLLEGSQLRGAGVNLFGNGYDKDIDGDDRPNAAWDIGADQFVGAAPSEEENALMFGIDL